MSFWVSMYNHLVSFWVRRSSESYCAFLRKAGIKVGSGVNFRHPLTTHIDCTRPSLVAFGNNIDINSGFRVLTHDYANFVFRQVFQDFVPVSGAVTIGDNVVFGVNVTILKGVSIGDNCIIGAGSVVTRSIPSNSVAVGVPAKVICGLREYYAKRRRLCLEEAFAYARSIEERFKRRPDPADFKEEFVLFISGGQEKQYPECPVKRQLGGAYEHWSKTHEAPFKNFEDFLSAAKQGAPRSKSGKVQCGSSALRIADEQDESRTGGGKSLITKELYKFFLFLGIRLSPLFGDARTYRIAAGF